MWRDKSPGVKILWIWTIGTATILVTNVARTRMRDMEKLVKSKEQQQSSHANEAGISDNPGFGSATEVIREEKL